MWWRGGVGEGGCIEGVGRGVGVELGVVLKESGVSGGRSGGVEFGWRGGGWRGGVGCCIEGVGGGGVRKG